jgi:hypothetical protein
MSGTGDGFEADALHAEFSPPERLRTPPKQFYAGSHAVAGIRASLEARLQAINDNESLSKSTDGSF